MRRASALSDKSCEVSASRPRLESGLADHALSEGVRIPLQSESFVYMLKPGFQATFRDSVTSVLIRQSRMNLVVRS